MRVRMIRISPLVEFGSPNPVSKREGETMWQMRGISNLRPDLRLDSTRELRQACRSGVSAVAVEAFVNCAG